MKPEIAQHPSVEMPDKLISFREVHALLGFRCKTSHTARSLRKRGLISGITLNERVTRYSLASVQRLIAQNIT
jgi:hypothetical protein